MYKREDFPKKGDLVLGTVVEISPIMVRVELDEYKNAYGIIPIDEISHRRIRNIKEVVDIGKKVVCLVLDADPATRLATLSLKRVSEGQKKMKLYQIKREQTAYNILTLLAKQKNLDEKEIYDKIIKPIISRGKYLYQVWEEAYIEGKEVLKSYNIPSNLIDDLYKLIKEHFNVPKYTRRGYIEMYTLAPDGIDRLKKVLSLLIEQGIEIKYAGAPNYYFKIEDYNPKELDKRYKEMQRILEEYSKKFDIEYEIVEEE